MFFLHQCESLWQPAWFTSFQSASPLSAERTLIGLLVFRAADSTGGFENWSAKFQNDNLHNSAAGIVTKAVASMSIWPRQGACKGAALKIFESETCPSLFN